MYNIILCYTSCQRVVSPRDLFFLPRNRGKITTTFFFIIIKFFYGTKRQTKRLICKRNKQWTVLLRANTSRDQFISHYIMLTNITRECFYPQLVRFCFFFSSPITTLTIRRLYNKIIKSKNRTTPSLASRTKNQSEPIGVRNNM